jgi:hypothetical protein
MARPLLAFLRMRSLRRESPLRAARRRSLAAPRLRNRAAAHEPAAIEAIFRTLREALDAGDVLDTEELAARCCRQLDDPEQRLLRYQTVYRFAQLAPLGLSALMAPATDNRSAVRALLDAAITVCRRGSTPDGETFIEEMLRAARAARR